MNRPRLMLAVFALCLAIVLAAMAWVSVVVVQLDRRDAAAQRQAEVEESARLALWRMDSALGPIIAREDTRPFRDYQAFYSSNWAFDENLNAHPGGRVVLPSSLLVQSSPFVRLHFQINPAGRISSPQVPEGKVPPTVESQLETTGQLATAMDRLNTLTGKLDREALLAVATASDSDSAQPPPPKYTVKLKSPWLDALNASNQMRQSTLPLARKQVGRARNEAVQQQLRSNMEYQQRVEANVQSSLINKAQRSSNFASNAASPSLTQSDEDSNFVNGLFAVDEGDMSPVWLGGELLLVRRVTLEDQTWVQGCWLDWESLRTWLLQRVSDLLPDAELLPADGPLAYAAPGEGPHLLAAIPARLMPGTFNGRQEALSVPIRTSLLVAWSCSVLAVMAVVVLVLGTVALSERRAAFVSAVTHELRTPLTTFRMYTEMLLGDMVTDESNRRDYLNTLRREADRLAQLVENVLSYARLERNRATMHVEETTAGALLDRFAERLRERARESAMELTITIDERAAKTALRTDGSAVEQIVFNLVDNACKYAASADDRQIELEIRSEPRTLLMAVTDHGPGVDTEVARRLFIPFSKSAKAAANSKLGVGLGLALSRRLARRLGGRLRLARNNGNGCRFELTLPR